MDGRESGAQNPRSRGNLLIRSEAMPVSRLYVIPANNKWPCAEYATRLSKGRDEGTGKRTRSRAELAAETLVYTLRSALTPPSYALRFGCDNILPFRVLESWLSVANSTYRTWLVTRFRG